jgi:drug/metabolite transporter (DMT)-like permease
VNSRDCQVTAADSSGVEATDPAGRLGIWMGCVAVLFWSFGSSLIYLGAKESGTWPFVAIATLIAGVLQLASRRAYHGELRTAIRLPWRLWIPVLCFVVYGLVWPCALVVSTRTQVGGVNLINYLWPVLTVLFSVWWVPGLRLTRPMAIALILALAGLICANIQPLRELVSNRSAAPAVTARQWLPYALASVAAVTWALYSALLARWRSWASQYVTSPIGFILVGVIACIVLVIHGPGEHAPGLFGLLATVLYGLGPLAAGYLLWELALARARVQALSLVAATTPVLSTLILCFCLKKLPGPDLVLAALLVSGGVVLSMRRE